MPIYEYACGSCPNRFETLQKASEDALRDCPACGASALRKLLSAPVFRLKGGGWYETDFKTGDRRNLAGAETGKSDADKAGKNGEGAKSAEGANGGGKDPAAGSDAKASARDKAAAPAKTGPAKPEARSDGAAKAGAGSAAGAG